MQQEETSLRISFSLARDSSTEHAGWQEVDIEHRRASRHGENPLRMTTVTVYLTGFWRAK